MSQKYMRHHSQSHPYKEEIKMGLTYSRQEKLVRKRVICLKMSSKSIKDHDLKGFYDIAHSTKTIHWYN